MTSDNISKKKGEPLPPTKEVLAQQQQKNEAAIRLLREWMADESGYDEKVGPIIDKALKENRFALRNFTND
jgi:hypothetical protein